MALETATYTDELVATNPVASDNKSQGDDHIRLIKSTILSTWPNVSGAVSASDVELSYVAGVTSAIQTQLGTKVTDGGTATDLTLAGTPVAPTATAGTNTTQVATTAFVQDAAFITALPNQSGNSGKFVTTDGTNASWSSDWNMLVSANDTTPGYLNGKLVAGTNITLTENNDAGDETLTVTMETGLEFIEEVTLAGTPAEVSIDLPSGYSEFILFFEDVLLTAGALGIQVSTNGGSSYVSTGYKYSVVYHSGTTPTNDASSSGSEGRLTNSEATGTAISGQVYLIPGGTNFAGNGQVATKGAGGSAPINAFSYFVVAGTGVDNIRLFSTTGAATFTGTGQIRLYGVRNA